MVLLQVCLPPGEGMPNSSRYLQMPAGVLPSRKSLYPWYHADSRTRHWSFRRRYTDGDAVLLVCRKRHGRYHSGGIGRQIALPPWGGMLTCSARSPCVFHGIPCHVQPGPVHAFHACGRRRRTEWTSPGS